MDLHILPECYVDTNLVETITKSRYNHKHGCNNVVKAMLEAHHLKDGFALGIVDEDKKILKYTEAFKVVVDKAQLKLLKHPLSISSKKVPKILNYCISNFPSANL